jgi:hypothetical protein
MLRVIESYLELKYDYQVNSTTLQFMPKICFEAEKKKKKKRKTKGKLIENIHTKEIS